MMDYLLKLTFRIVRAAVPRNKQCSSVWKAQLEIKRMPESIHGKLLFFAHNPTTLRLVVHWQGLFFSASTLIFVPLGWLKSPTPLNVYIIEMSPQVSSLPFLIFHRNIWWMDNKGFRMYRHNFGSCIFVHIIRIVLWNINHKMSGYLSKYWYVRPILLTWIYFNQSMDKQLHT